MTDRELIIDALRDYEQNARGWIGGAHRDELSPDQEAEEAKKAEDARRVRVELEDNADYVVRGAWHE